MKFKKSQDKKKEFDQMVALYLANKIFTPISQTDAYKEHIIDGVGNVIKNPMVNNEWAFTVLDKIILGLKQHFGEAKLKDLLKNLEWTGDVDPFLIINSKQDSSLNKIKDTLKLIITKVEDADYMPDKIEHKEEFLQESEESFRTRVSFAITLATVLLYSLRNDEVPDEIYFRHNVIPSVELTFSITPSTDYDKCITFIKKNNLVD